MPVTEPRGILDSAGALKERVAEFWLPVGNALVHIRYFAVRDEGGRYRGTLEVTQDIAPLRAIDGERRLLSWQDQ